MAGRKRPMRKHFNATQDQEDLENLFVFGYECKIFRDDEKALYVDSGHHLIPWMGDTSLLIDRYDGRGHLYDLHDYDAANTKSLELSDEEKRIEALCDEERYFELHTDVAEKALYEEEELKRLNQAFNECNDLYGSYGAVGFNYGYGEDDEEQDSQEDRPGENEDEEDELFYVTPDLQMPEGMVPPLTEKVFTIIEKTAKFVSKQGTQMEIIIKIKQADNPQFAFLEHQDPLNPFYKHLVFLMKAGKYKSRDAKEQSSSEGTLGQEYLHPKLMKLMKQEPEPELNRKDFLESVQSKLPSGQITNTVYAKLVNKMKASNSGRNSPVAPIRRTPPPQMVEKSMAVASGSGYRDDIPIGPIQYPMMAAAGYPEHSESSSSIYSVAQMNIPPPPGMEPVTLPSASTSSQPPPPGTVPPDPDPELVDLKTEEEHAGPLLTKDYMDTEVPLDVTLPAPETQQIIDKMAAYVAKNGPDFEHIVKNKNDERFHFLQSWHIHNKYYEYRKKIYLQEMATKNVKVTITQTTQNAVGDTVVTKTTTTLANMQPGKGVSFSIKAKENEGSALTNRKIMLYDSSDDDEGEAPVKKEGEDPSDSRGSEGPSFEKSLERIKSEKAPVDPEELERRHAEERLKDKISQAAREKVAAAGREKQLQAERKRRAAMFINMLKSSDAPASKSSSSGPGSVSSGKDENSKEAGPTSLASSNCSTPQRESPGNSRTPSPVILVHSRGNSASKSPPRTRSPSRADWDRERDWDRLRHRDRDRTRDRERDRDVEWRTRRVQWSPRRSRSPAWRRRSPSPRRRRHRSKTPPSAYTIVRRSNSPQKRSRSRSRSQSKSHRKKSKKSRSSSRDRAARGAALAISAPKTKKSRKSKSRSKSPSRKHKFKSESGKNVSRSRSPSSKKTKKSKHRSKSPSQSKSHKRSSTRHSPIRSRSSLPAIEEVRTSVTGNPPLPPSDPQVPSRPPLPPSTPPGTTYKDDDVIIISPDKEEPPSPSETTPTPGTPSSSKGQPDAPVSKDLLNKVRAMLKATRQQIIKEDGLILD